ncbi:MAG: hypothetical protein WCC01_02820 [Acidimicrobiia bacterium]
MRRSTGLVLGSLLLLAVALPAFALEDGIAETSSMTPSDDRSSTAFERTITNTSDAVVDIEPRDLRMAEYPTMTASKVTVGSFTSGIWSIGELKAGQTATIAYVGHTEAPEELPFTGPRTRLVALAILGIVLIAFGTVTVRSTRA